MTNDTLFGLSVGIVINTFAAHFMIGSGFGCGLLFSLVPFCMATVRILPERMQKNGLPELLLIGAVGSGVSALVVLAT
jgi:hypothetical protein